MKNLLKDWIRTLVVAAGLGTGSTGWAALDFTGSGGSYSVTSPGSQVIADYPSSGLAYALNFNDVNAIQITAITFTFTTTGGWNGDMYAYLSHGSALAILLNKVGASSGAPDGYSTSGFNTITLAMGALPDIHGVSSPTAVGSPYAADGRLDYTSATRNNTLDVFNNTNPNGSWTLYFGDLAPVNESTLTSWSLGITSVVPEPANVALGIFGAVFALLQLGRRSRVRKWILDVARR